MEKDSKRANAKKQNGVKKLTERKEHKYKADVQRLLVKLGRSSIGSTAEGYFVGIDLGGIVKLRWWLANWGYEYRQANLSWIPISTGHHQPCCLALLPVLRENSGLTDFIGFLSS